MSINSHTSLIISRALLDERGGQRGRGARLVVEQSAEAAGIRWKPRGIETVLLEVQGRVTPLPSLHWFFSRKEKTLTFQKVDCFEACLVLPVPEYLYYLGNTTVWIRAQEVDNELLK